MRVGTVVAHDRKSADAWRAELRRGARPAGGGLTGAGLERAVMALAMRNPEYVQLATRAA